MYTNANSMMVVTRTLKNSIYIFLNFSASTVPFFIYVIWLKHLYHFSLLHFLCFSWKIQITKKIKLQKNKRRREDKKINQN